MQSLDVISVNIWQMLASLANLVLLFLIVKRFLYKPVKATLEKRRAAIDSDYSEAANARKRATEDMKAYEEKLRGANAEADSIIKTAAEKAALREKEMLYEAKLKADGIVKRAEADALYERKRAEDEIRREIVEVSTLLSEKMLEREVSADDHRQLIDSFIEGIGSGDEAN